MTSSEFLDEQQQTSTRITLGLLNAVEEESAVTQRHLAAHLGIAVGLVNAYLKRCVNKGLIKVQQVPRRRYAYYLTPQGFAEKSRLTASYLAHSLDFFRKARASCDGALRSAAEKGWKSVVLVGGSDLAEIVLVCALNHPLQVIAVVEPGGGTAGENFSSLPVLTGFDGLSGACDGAIITEIADTQAAYDGAARALGAGRVILPDLLAPAVGAEDGRR